MISIAVDKVFKIFSITVLAIMLLTSCGVPDSQEIADSLLIYYYDGIFQQENQVKAGWGLEARVMNRSDYCVIFPYDYGIKIYFRKAGGEDVEVSNTVNYTFLENAPMVERIDGGSQGSIMLAPDLTNITVNAPREFRATITGHLCDDETVEITKEIIFFVVP